MNNPKVEIILTDNRRINLVLYPQSAPLTVKNFLKLVGEGFYDGVCFHRVINNFMIQTGGYCYDFEKGLIEKPDTPNIVGEFNRNKISNDILHRQGVISMARTNVFNSASSQFFICSVDCPHLDGNYAAFGQVSDLESLKVVQEIASSKTIYVSPNFTDFAYPPIVIKNIILKEDNGERND